MLVDRIMVIKPVEIFCILFGVHWISSPTQKLFFFAVFHETGGGIKDKTS